MAAGSGREFRRIGFFHFGNNYSQPIVELEASLLDAQRQEEIRDSLIVLPEGFNIGIDYSRDVARGSDCPSVLLKLAAIASRFSLVLVAGLIVKESGGASPPYNSAFLIDGCSEPVLMCHKRNQDNTVGRYKTCNENYDLKNPIAYRNCSIAALICMDGFQQDGEDVQRHLRLLKELSKEAGHFGVICVPAHMYRENEGIAQGWGDNYVVFANSYANGKRRSYIAKGGILKDHFTAEGPINRIVLTDLDGGSAAPN